MFIEGIEPVEGEEWAYTGYDGYYVSSIGRVIGPGRYNRPNLLTPTKNSKTGYLYVTIFRNGEKKKEYVHRLVAEAFIPNPNHYPVVRHLNDIPYDDRVENLAWGTATDNMQDCIKHGRFRYFTEEDREAAMRIRRRPVKAINLITGEEFLFESQQEASRVLGISQTSISSVLFGKSSAICNYYFCDPEESIDISNYIYGRHNGLIKATNLETGEELVFRGQTEAARVLGMSVASVCNVLRKKQYQAKGYHFDYMDERSYENAD